MTLSVKSSLKSQNLIMRKQASKLTIISKLHSIYSNFEEPNSSYIYIYKYIWLHSNIEKCLDVVYEGPLLDS